MKEKILTVLVVVSLVLSILNLALTLRTNGSNIIQPTLDPETAKADSFELEAKDAIYDLTIRRENNITVYHNFENFNETKTIKESSNQTATFHTVTTFNRENKTDFLNLFYVLGENPYNYRTEMMRCENNFFFSTNTEGYLFEPNRISIENCTYYLYTP